MITVFLMLPSVVYLRRKVDSPKCVVVIPVAQNILNHTLLPIKVINRCTDASIHREGGMISHSRYDFHQALTGPLLGIVTMVFLSSISAFSGAQISRLCTKISFWP